MTRKRIVAPDTAKDQIDLWMQVFQVVAASPTALRQAMTASAEGLFSFWDALLLATVAEAGCSVLYSEDMAEGAELGGCTVRRPFT